MCQAVSPCALHTLETIEENINFDTPRDQLRHTQKKIKRKKNYKVINSSKTK